MGNETYNSYSYDAAVQHLSATGQTFARSNTARASGNYTPADHLNPRKLKNGMREACFADGFNDATPIVVSIDCTGSMQEVPHHIQKELSKLVGLLLEEGITDHPNILFIGHDDEYAMRPDAVFQMSQFETDAEKILNALNELIIPLNGGGNNGEAYHASFYAVANHTRTDEWDQKRQKGFFFLIGDEHPYYYNGDPKVKGTTKEFAEEVFGDKNENEVPMLESVKKTVERYHVFVIRPGHTHHGQDASITKEWQKLLRDAGENPEHVMEVQETSAIIPTMVLSIGQILGVDNEGLVDVLRSKGANVDSAIDATKALVDTSTHQSTVLQSRIETSDKPSPRKRK